MSSIVNLIKNANFDGRTTADTEQWSISSFPSPNLVSYTQNPNECYTGDSSLYMQKLDASEGGVYQLVNFNRNIAGEAFDVGAWIKITSIGGGSLDFIIQWMDANDAFISNSTVGSISAIQNYTLTSDTVVAPANATQFVMYFKCSGASVMVVNIDSCYAYGYLDYGLEVSDTVGNAVFLTPDISTVIAQGTTSLSNSLNADGSYGTEISIPTLTDVDSNDIGVICQVRDFNWKTKIKTIDYDSGDHYWGNFYGDSTITYYERDRDLGTMTPWTAGNLTDGDKTTWNPLMSIGLVSGWQKKSLETSKVQLFSAMKYSFLDNNPSTSPKNVSLYMRPGELYINQVYATAVGTVQGDSATIEDQDGPLGYDMSLYPEVTWSVYLVHADGSMVTLGTNIAYARGRNWWTETRYGGLAEDTLTGTWTCAARSMLPTDSLKFVQRVDSWWLNRNGYLVQWWMTAPFTTGHLGLSYLNATTWSFQSYVGVYTYPYQWGQMYTGKFLRYYGGTGVGAKETKITGINAYGYNSGLKDVYSIGDSGVAEVDYMVYMKNYRGLS